MQYRYAPVGEGDIYIAEATLNGLDYLLAYHVRQTSFLDSGDGTYSLRIHSGMSWN